MPKVFIIVHQGVFWGAGRDRILQLILDEGEAGYLSLSGVLRIAVVRGTVTTEKVADREKRLRE